MRGTPPAVRGRNRSAPRRARNCTKRRWCSTSSDTRCGSISGGLPPGAKSRRAQWGCSSGASTTCVTRFGRRSASRGARPRQLLTLRATGVFSLLVTSEVRSPKRWLIGEPLASEKLEGQLLPKHLALPIFASDALSSVAYAPQELLLILTLGGLAFLSFAPWVAAAVVLLLIVVVSSYRQLIKAYPSGGGDYEVAHRNLGEKAGLVVASALLVDYILTVTVSVASGVDNIISAFPVLNTWRVEIAVAFVILLAAINLRGVAESSKAFALPTYLFIASVGVMIVTGLVRTWLGDTPVAASSAFTVKSPESLTQIAFVLLLLRAFASGCSALTGVEAVANGVQAFRRPKIKNAQLTLVFMGGIAIVLFIGIMALAL